MKKYFLFSVLFIQASTICFNEDRHDHVKFDSLVIRLIDGTSLVDVAEIVHYAKNLFRLSKGTTCAEATALFKEYNIPIDHPFEQYANEKGHIGLVWFHGNYHTMKDMRTLEKQYAGSPELAGALWQIIDLFDKLSANYITEIEAGKHIMIKLIDQWSRLRNRPNTLLLNWANIDTPETEGLHVTMATFEIFDTFVNDLMLFLKDFINNCPKSKEAYLKQQTHESTGKN